MKIRYEIDLVRPVSPPPPEGVAVRPLSADDVEMLASLMLDAYRGTIDYEGESYDDAVGEVRSFFADDPLLEHSYTATVAGEAVSAVLVSLSHGEPFIGYVMTHPDHKNRGIGRHLVAVAMSSLAAAGYRRIVLYITDGNVASEALFGGVGARPTNEP